MKLLSRFLRWFSSLKVTCALLALLIALIFWGTLFEARAGIEWGVERFFDSWVVFSAGVFPVPALKTLAVLLFANIALACVFRIPRRWTSVGLYLIHLSFLLLIAGCFAGSFWRTSSERFALVGPDVPRAHAVVAADSSDGELFRVLAADSSGASVEVLEQNGNYAFRIAPNFPLKRASKIVYFENYVPLSPESGLVRFWIRNDPFGFVPYLFFGLFLAGILVYFVILCREKTRFFN